MIITYHGKQFFKLQQSDYTLAYNPIAKENKLKLKNTRFGSHVALVSARHPYYNGTENTSFGDTQSFVVQGPGSYEINGVTIDGFASKALIDDVSYINTIYFVTIDDISYCFIGDLESIEIDQQIKEFTDKVDVLFVPIGNNGTLSPSTASKVVKMFSPKVIIPMDYGEGRDEGSLESFLKETGSHNEKLEKFVFKKSDLEKMTDQVIVLEEQ